MDDSMEEDTPPPDHYTIRNVISRLRVDSQAADMVFVISHEDLNEQIRIPIHSFILILRSDYFRDLLNTSSEATGSHEIDIGVHNIAGACAFRYLVDWLYRDDYHGRYCKDGLCDRSGNAGTRSPSPEDSKHEPLYVHQKISQFAQVYRIKGKLHLYSTGVTCAN